MIVTIHQPEHLPWLGFMDKMRRADLFVLLDTTQFAKDDFQNRNRVKTHSGPTWLTIPVYKKGKSKQRILDVEICNDRNWRQRCWTLIAQNYQDAPFFSQYQHFFQDLYAESWEKLVDLNTVIIRYLAAHFAPQTKIIRASELGVYEQGATNVNFTICQTVGATSYLSGKMGREYLDETPFRTAGIDVIYQEFHHPVYPQLWGEFTPYMSAIDYLFNCGHSGNLSGNTLLP